jgi:hypothetical protein
MAALAGNFVVIPPLRPDQFVIVGEASWMSGNRMTKKEPHATTISLVTNQFERALAKDRFAMMGKLAYKWPLLALRVRQEQLKRYAAAQTRMRSRNRAIRAQAKRAAIHLAANPVAKAAARPLAAVMPFAARAAAARRAAAKAKAAPQARARPRARLPLFVD